MKKNLKYRLFLVSTLLLHSTINEAMEDFCAKNTTELQQERCYVSQNHPVCNFSEELHLVLTLSTKSQEINLEEHNIFPILLDSSPLCSPDYYLDPIIYYIYGLRKIVI